MNTLGNELVLADGKRVRVLNTTLVGVGPHGQQQQQGVAAATTTSGGKKTSSPPPTKPTKKGAAGQRLNR
jgi:hypothetical protein